MTQEFKVGDYVVNDGLYDGHVFQVTNPNPPSEHYNMLGNMAIYMKFVSSGLEVCSSKHSLRKLSDEEVMLLKLAGKI